MSIDIKKKRVADAVMAFQKDNLYEDSVHLFQALDYNTSRTMGLKDGSFKSFNEEFEAEKEGFNKQRALTDDWKEIQLLFQLTADEMMDQLPMFHATVNRDEPASFLFFAVELSGDEYSRSKLADIAREVNKPFKMDVFLLFKYGNYITLSLIERRPNKKFYDKDVIEKVTHIYNINIAKPHAGHIHILNSFSFESLAEETKRKRIESFKDLQIGWKKAVSTQLLNKQFYKEYSRLSTNLIRVVYPRQIDNKLAAHQGILNLLNRIMFIYFVQKKEWLMKDQDFMITFWNRYLEEGYDGKNLFHQHWLSTVFFHAFNNELYNSKSLKHIPEDLQSAFTYFPYLNGGLFSYHKDYDHFVLEDKHIHSIFQFFEGYIFTITEDTPYDVNLEINPELLGKMYEGMINATDLDDVDAEHGIIYTERPEINFMVRRSLVEVLDKKLNPDTNKKFEREFLYHFVFDTPAEKLQLLRKKKTDVNSLRNAITTITACDPACGSGSMLLGLLIVQMEMLRVIDENLGTPHEYKDDFIIKKQLISECIYGVDVKEWAVRIAELRLWLYMIAEADFTTEELTKEPLLPNLDFKLRTGNSLLQKFGDLDFTVEDLLKGKKKSAGKTKNLNDYIKKKKAFIQNQADNNTTYDNLKEEERAVFLDFIRELITEKEQGIHNRKVRQGSMFSGAEQKDIFEYETKKLNEEIEQLKKLRSFIIKERRLPFSYDIDFMEVFMAKDDDHGFDLIIGNPPYVRQEDILPPEDPELLEELLQPKNKQRKAAINKRLKAALNAQVYKIYPFLNSKQTFRIKKLKEVKEAGKKAIKEVDVDEKIPVYGNKVSGRSDLYVYFQLIAPHYLNSKGTFCFIISNSWLDVDFGAFVQQFLLKHTSLYAVYDCYVRSFEAAVNTIIYLHGTIEYPNLQGGRTGLYKLAEPINNVSRFVMNKIDYTQAAYAPLLIDQDGCKQNTFTEFFRCIPVTQEQLYINGYDEKDKQYAGDLWGGKYLRAPEIYYKILEKGKNILVKLEELAQVISVSWSRLGYNDDLMFKKSEQKKAKDKIIPVLKSPRDVKKILLSNSDTTNYLIERDDIKGKIVYAELLWVDLRNDKHLCHYCSEKIAFTHNFHGIIPKEKYGIELCSYLNSSLSCFFVEVLGRGNLGEGAIRILANDLARQFPSLLIKNSEIINRDFLNREQKNIFKELGIDPKMQLRLQKPNPLLDRKALDKIVFDALNLTPEERNEVYWSLAELVQQRLDKALSR